MRPPRLAQRANGADSARRSCRKRHAAGRVHLEQGADDVVHAAAEQKPRPAPVITTAWHVALALELQEVSRSSA